MSEASVSRLEVKMASGAKRSFKIYGLNLEEKLSNVSNYVIDIADEFTQLSEFVGQIANIEFKGLEYRTLKARKFAGVVIEATRSVTRNNEPFISLRLVSPMGLLKLSSNSAIYQNQNVVSIIKDVLKRNGLQRTYISSKSTEKRDTVIQYNENDLSFCERLLSEEGLTYYFNDGKDPLKLVIHNSKNKFPKIGERILLTDAQLSDVTRLGASQISMKSSFIADNVSLLTYDNASAAQKMVGPKKTSDFKTSIKPSLIEFKTVALTDLSSNDLEVKANAEAVDQEKISGTCEHPGLHLGQEIDLKSVGYKDLNGQYTITELNYSLTRGNALSCKFVACPLAQKPSPELKPKPYIGGVHNAVVVGGAAGDIACDKYGRVKVKFFWDTSEKKENTSCYVRVSQPFAGNGYGAQFLPRVDHEVLVSFLHGDPDAPVITGQVYTQKNLPPFAKANTTKSGILTKLKGNKNEFEFDDKKDEELLALRTAKDFELTCRNDAVVMVEKEYKRTIKASMESNVKKNYKSQVAETAQYKAKEVDITAEKKITLKVGSSKLEITSSGILLTAPKIELKAKSAVEAEALNINLKSKAALNLESKGSFNAKTTIGKIDAKAKLDINGTMVNISGKAQAKMSSPLSEVSGQGILTLKGPLTMIN